MTTRICDAVSAASWQRLVVRQSGSGADSGWGVFVSSQDAPVSAGEVVLRTGPAGGEVVFDELRGEVCDFCLRLTDADDQPLPLTKCPGCNRVFYCDRLECVTLFRRCHCEGQECGVVRYLAKSESCAEEALGSGLLMILRLCVRLRAQAHTNMIAEEEEEEDGGPLERSSPQALVAELCENEAQFKSLPECEERRKSLSLLEAYCNDVLLVECTEARQLGLSGQVVRSLFLRIESNSFGLWNRSSAVLGVAVFPTASFFNHSCAPNIVFRRVPGGGELEAVALRDLQSGEELVTSYVSTGHSRRERQEKLLLQYLFTCTCDACGDLSGFVSDRFSLAHACRDPGCPGLVYPIRSSDSLRELARKCSNCEGEFLKSDF